MLEAVHAFADGELPLEVQPAVFSHLATCAECRRTLDSVLHFRRLSRQERIVVTPAADAAFLERLQQHKARKEAVNRSEDRQPLWRIRTSFSLRTGVLAMLFVFCLGLIVPSDRSESEESAAPLSLVEGFQEPIFPSQDSTDDRGMLYVFYPGLTVEADRFEEPGGVGPL